MFIARVKASVYATWCPLSFSQVQIKTHQKADRTSYLSGHVKDAVKQFANKRYRAASKSLLADQGCRKVLLSELTKILQQETGQMVKKSGFRQSDPRKLNILSLYGELQYAAPTFTTFLKGAIGPKVTKKMFSPIVTAAAILLKTRNNRACSLQKLIGSLLYQGQLKHKVKKIITYL